MPFLGIGLQLAIGMLILIVPVYVAAVGGGAGAVELVEHLTSVIFGPIGYALAAAFSVAMLSWRFESVRASIRRGRFGRGEPRRES